MHESASRRGLMPEKLVPMEAQKAEKQIPVEAQKAEEPVPVDA